MVQEDTEKNIKKGKVEIIDSINMEIEKEVPPNLSRNYKTIIHKKLDNKK